MASAETTAELVVNNVVKEKKPRASKGSKPPPSHPTYLQMISETIISLKERTGSSQCAIAAYIGTKYQSQLPANYKKMLTVQLRNLAKSCKLTKVKNSFKLSAELKKPVNHKAVKSLKPKVPPKKSAAKLKAAPGLKKVSKPAAKASAKVAKAPKVLKRKPVVSPKKLEKAAAPAKKAAPAKNTAPAKKAAPAKKLAPAKKPAKPVKKASPPKPRKVAPAAKKVKR